MPRESAARAQRRTEASITPESGQPLIDLDFVKGLIEAVDQSSIDTVEISRSGTRIRIAKTPPPAPVSMMANGLTHAAPASAPVAAPAAAAPAAAECAPAPAAAPKSNLIDIKSPMVGTFYRAPAPEAPSYVELGTTVRKGQTLCILEAMKLMNELECEVEGVVREILAENADPVEYGQVLFRVEPA